MTLVVSHFAHALILDEPVDQSNSSLYCIVNHNIIIILNALGFLAGT